VHKTEQALIIASEIKAILVAAHGRFRVNPSVAGVYVRQGLLDATPETFFEGIEMLPAGSLLRVPVQRFNRSWSPQRYWSIPAADAPGPHRDRLIDTVRETFIDAVRMRLRSDVPVGILLSGGTDSSSIAAAAHHLSPRDDGVRLIAAVGDRRSRGEEAFIDIVARHLGRPVEKVALDYGPEKALELLRRATWFNDEPVGGFSTVAHHLLMERARQVGVTVLLSGQGGDETLCGYKKYLPFYLQELLRAGRWARAGKVLSQFWRQRTVLSQIDYREGKRYLPRWMRLPEIDVLGPALREADVWNDVGLGLTGVVDRQIADIERYSVPALVHYEDRMSMAASREIRLPFLDYRLVSLLTPLPVDFKMHDGWTKWIFRKAMEPLLPSEIVWRKDKQGFIVPQSEWLHRELRDGIYKLLEEEWVSDRLGLLKRDSVRMRYEAYLRQGQTGGRIGQKDVFAPIALEVWARCFEGHLTS